MQFETVDAREHKPDEYADVFDGYRAIRMIDDAERLRGELVWRLASGQTVEITEFGIYDEAGRRRGWGSQLLEAGIASVRQFFGSKPYRLRRIYLFCDSINDAGRAFYESCGFSMQAQLKDFYQYCDAVLYVRNAEADGAC